MYEGNKPMKSVIQALSALWKMLGMQMENNSMMINVAS